MDNLYWQVSLSTDGQNTALYQIPEAYLPLVAEFQRLYLSAGFTADNPEGWYACIPIS